MVLINKLVKSNTDLLSSRKSLLQELKQTRCVMCLVLQRNTSASDKRQSVVTYNIPYQQKQAEIRAEPAAAYPRFCKSPIRIDLFLSQTFTCCKKRVKKPV